MEDIVLINYTLKKKKKKKRKEEEEGEILEAFW